MGYKASQFLSGGNNTFIKSDDVKSTTLVLTVGSVESAKTPDGASTLQLVFTDGRKLTLNKVNMRILQGLIGDDVDAWVRRRISIGYDPTVMYAGKMVGGIRVRPIQEQQAPATTPPTATTTGEGGQGVPF